MARKIAPAKTPTIAIARALRSIGLVQGRDFKVEGVYRRCTAYGERIKERTGTQVSLFGTHAERVVWERAEEIERYTQAEGYTFGVRSIAVTAGGHRILAVGNVYESNWREVRKAEAEAAKLAEVRALGLPDEAAHLTPDALIRFAAHVFQTEGNTDAWHAISGAMENADQTMSDDGQPYPGHILWSDFYAKRWAEIAIAGWETHVAAGLPSDELPTLAHPLAVDYFGWEIEAPACPVNPPVPGDMVNLRPVGFDAHLYDVIAATPAASGAAVLAEHRTPTGRTMFAVYTLTPQGPADVVAYYGWHDPETAAKRARLAFYDREHELSASPPSTGSPPPPEQPLRARLTTGPTPPPTRGRPPCTHRSAAGPPLRHLPTESSPSATSAPLASRRTTTTTPRSARSTPGPSTWSPASPTSPAPSALASSPPRRPSPSTTNPPGPTHHRARTATNQPPEGAPTMTAYITPAMLRALTYAHETRQQGKPGIIYRGGPQLGEPGQHATAATLSALVRRGLVTPITAETTTRRGHRVQTLDAAQITDDGSAWIEKLQQLENAANSADPMADYVADMAAMHDVFTEQATAYAEGFELVDPPANFAPATDDEEAPSAPRTLPHVTIKARDLKPGHLIHECCADYILVLEVIEKFEGWSSVVHTNDEHPRIGLSYPFDADVIVSILTLSVPPLAAPATLTEQLAAEEIAIALRALGAYVHTYGIEDGHDVFSNRQLDVARRVGHLWHRHRPDLAALLGDDVETALRTLGELVETYGLEDDENALTATQREIAEKIGQLWQADIDA
ncbi:hypothetical protein [Nonomuraea typhae]|uniref:hypothetical protein n=1 Tax=Nonomuraea typhae TaxID=2603600 RepID=UPI0012FA1779|nr:hypothetical protein [Nonomuraea typhae]